MSDPTKVLAVAKYQWPDNLPEPRHLNICDRCGWTIYEDHGSGLEQPCEGACLDEDGIDDQPTVWVEVVPKARLEQAITQFCEELLGDGPVELAENEMLLFALGRRGEENDCGFRLGLQAAINSVVKGEDDD